MADSFDIQSLIKKVRVSINPELGVPADEKENPINYRIIRLRKLVKETMTAQKAVTADLTKIESSLMALLEELNPELDLKDESKAKEAADKAEQKTDAAAKETSSKKTDEPEQTAKSTDEVAADKPAEASKEKAASPEKSDDKK